MSTIKRNGNLGQSFEQVGKYYCWLWICCVKFEVENPLDELLVVDDDRIIQGDEGEADAGRGGEEKGS